LVPGVLFHAAGVVSNRDVIRRKKVSNEQEHTTVISGAPRWIGIAVALLAILAIAGIAVGSVALQNAKNNDAQLQTQAASLKQDNQTLADRLSKTEEANAQAQGELNVITDKLKLTQGELSSARKQAKEIRDDYNNQISELQSNVSGELAKKATNDDVKAVSSDVTGVKSDLESTKQNLQMARGELGTLIARDHDDIEQLRRLGERDYYEFTISKKGDRQKVGDMSVELRGTDLKKHQFSVTLFVDDMRLEKNNRAINEPIYFYTHGTRAPLELVVNQVDKNKVVGYVSVPKANAQPSSAASTGGNGK
jgi:hypothetical protein